MQRNTVSARAGRIQRRPALYFPRQTSANAEKQMETGSVIKVSQRPIPRMADAPGMNLKKKYHKEKPLSQRITRKRETMQEKARDRLHIS